jgi:hypothetical protein
MIQTIEELNELKATILKKYKILNDFLEGKAKQYDKLNEMIKKNHSDILSSKYKSVAKNILDLDKDIQKLKIDTIEKVNNFLELKPEFIPYEIESVEYSITSTITTPTPLAENIKLNNDIHDLEEFQKVIAFTDEYYNLEELYSDLLSLRELYSDYEDKNCKNTNGDDCSFFSDKRCYLNGNELGSECVPNSDYILQDLIEIPQGTSAPYMDKCVEGFTNVTRPTPFPCGDCLDPFDCFKKNQVFCGKSLTQHLTHITYHANKLDLYFKNNYIYIDDRVDVYKYNKNNGWNWMTGSYNLKPENKSFNFLKDDMNDEYEDISYKLDNDIDRIETQISNLKNTIGISENGVIPTFPPNNLDEMNSALEKLKDLVLQLEQIKQIGNLNLASLSKKIENLNKLDYKISINLNSNDSLLGFVFKAQNAVYKKDYNVTAHYFILDVKNQQIISVDKTNPECSPIYESFPFNMDIITKFLPIFNSFENMKKQEGAFDNSNFYGRENINRLNDTLFGNNSEIKKQCSINVSNDFSINSPISPDNFELKIPKIGNSEKIASLSEDCCKAILDYCDDNTKKLSADELKCEFYKDTCTNNNRCLIPSIVDKNKKCNIDMCDKLTKLFKDFKEQAKPFTETIIRNKKCADQQDRLDEFNTNLNNYYMGKKYNNYMDNEFITQNAFKEFDNLYCKDPNKVIVPNNTLTNKYMNLLCKFSNGINNQSKFDSKLPEDYQKCGSYELKFNPPKLENELTSVCESGNFNTLPPYTPPEPEPEPDQEPELSNEERMKMKIGDYKPAKSNINTLIPHLKVSKECNKFMINNMTCENNTCKKEKIVTKTDFYNNEDLINEKIEKCVLYNELNTKCNLKDPNLIKEVEKFKKLEKKEYDFNDKELNQIKWMRDNYKCFKWNKHFKDERRFLTKTNKLITFFIYIIIIPLVIFFFLKNKN